MNQSDSFYWYDLETFGVDKKADRIAQFAGVRTDTNLNIIGEPDELFCQPVLDYLPNPESCLVTGITPDQCETQGLKEAEFSNTIHDIFHALPNTCVAGYNNIRFDDELIRFLLYRNLHDPYTWHWKNNNSRWDILDVMRITYALRPEGIQWPRNEDGKPSFKLEDLAAANSVQHESAHNAVSDVLATVALARLIKQKQPRLFSHCLNLRNKQNTARLLDHQNMLPVVHVSGKISSERGHLAVMIPLAPMPGNQNAVIAYDLSHDPDDLLSLDADAIRERVFTRQDELPEGHRRVPLKTIHTNRSPILAPLGVLKDADLNRLQLDWDAIKTHWRRIRQAPSSLRATVQQALVHQDFPQPDVDEALYADGFTSNDDRYRLDTLRVDAPDSLRHLPAFDNPKWNELAWRYLARNWPETLSEKETSRWLQESADRLQQRHGPGLTQWRAKLTDLQHQYGNDAKKQAILQSLAHWFEKKAARLPLK